MSDSKLEKILIIDDNSDYRKLISTFLSKLLPGVEVLEYDPVFEGVPDDDFNWSDIDVLLLDYHLSIVGITGLDILHKHHKKSSFPATIMLTGAGTEEIAIRALKSGIYEYQPKQTLTKDKLKQSIIHAWEEKKSDRKKKQEITQHNRSFSKEVFYENLERAFDSTGPERALVIIRPDNVELLEEEIGIIGRDSLVNHIAKHSFEVFKLGACNPNITRISDTEIGVQIDYPINKETLEFNMQGLCNHLAKCTFKFAEEKYKFSVSIGVLKLGVFNKSAEHLIAIASTACDHASKTDGNFYYIWKDTDVVREAIKHDDDENINQEKITSVLDSTGKTETVISPADTEKLEAELKVKEKETWEQARLRAEQEAKIKADAEAIIKTAKEEKEKLEAQLKAKEDEAREQAQLRAEHEAKEKADAEAIIKAAKEEKEKLEAELKAKEEEAREQAQLRAEHEAKEKADAEAIIKAAKEEKEKLEAELKAKEEEVKEKADSEALIKAVKEEKEKLENELKAKEEEARKQAQLRADQEAKEKADSEAMIKAVKEEKEKLEAQLKAKEEEAREQAQLRAEQEAKEKADAEAMLKAAKEEKEKLEAELKAIAKAKADADAEIKAAKEEKEKLEAELKAIAEAKADADTKVEVKSEIKTTEPSPRTENRIEEESSKSNIDDQQENNENVEKDSGPSIGEIEVHIKKLIDEKKIIQTYQPVTAMFSDEDEAKEIYKTGLQSIMDTDNINQYLSDTSIFSIPLQQTVNEWILRQVFLRITESGTTNCQFSFLITVTESWFSDITLFQWLQKILSQTKKYNPGKSIILNVPLDIFRKHQKRAEALINTLRKLHHFTISLSNIDAVDNILNHCSLTSSSLLMVDIEQLKKLSETLSPEGEQGTNNEDNEEKEKQNLLQTIKSKNIRIITSGIEDSTLLTDAITAGTDYTLGNFVGEVQDSLVASGTVESFELT